MKERFFVSVEIKAYKNITFIERNLYHKKVSFMNLTSLVENGAGTYRKIASSEMKQIFFAVYGSLLESGETAFFQVQIGC